MGGAEEVFKKFFLNFFILIPILNINIIIIISIFGILKKAFAFLACNTPNPKNYLCMGVSNLFFPPASETSSGYFPVKHP